LSGEVLGLYVSNASKDLRYTNDEKGVGQTYKENVDMEVTVGTGIGSNFIDESTVLFPQRIFNGILKYTVNASKYKVNFPVAKNLSTTLDGGNRGTGCVFTVTAKQWVKLLGVDIHTNMLNESVEVEIWTRLGSYERHAKNMDGWERIAYAKVIGQGEGVLTSIDYNDFDAVEMLSGQFRSFYVTLKTNNLLYSNGIKSGAEFRSDDALIINEGLGIYSYPLSQEASIYHPRVYNGNIHYTILD